MTVVTQSDCFKSSLAPDIVKYLALKRALGRKAASIEYHLHRLDRFLTSQNFVELTQGTFAAWCQSMEAIGPNTRRGRMRTVYHFCLFRRREDPACFVPDPAQFPPLRPRPLPYIFSESEITQLLVKADTLAPHKASPLYPQIARIGVALLYTTGLRRSEIVHFTLADYDANEQVLAIRETKFYKSRIVPLSADAALEIRKYLSARQSHFSCHPSDPLLVHNHGGRNRKFTGAGFGNMMRKLFRAANIRTVRGCSPRVHDLRFTFAVHALLRWYRAGIDVQTRLPALAAFMGHVSVVSTQYYLTFCQATAESASERYHTHCSVFLNVISKGGGQ
jgi:integrase/recombinase XerD